jgi:chloride channel 3/4/5
MAAESDADLDGDPYCDMTTSQHSAPSQLSVPSSPTYTRRRSMRSRRQSASEQTPDERTTLLGSSRSRLRLRSPNGSATPKSPRISRHHSYHTGSKHHSRAGSFGQRLINALGDRQESLVESKGSIFADERVWYDQFTSTDWVHDSIADAYRVKALRSRRGVWAKVIVLFDGAQGWILSAVVGFLVAVLAYCVNVAETTIFDYKDGYCAKAWYLREKASRS